MAKRNKNDPAPPDVPAALLIGFFVIAVIVAFAKTESKSRHAFAQASGTDRTAASSVAWLNSQYSRQSSSIGGVSRDAEPNRIVTCESSV